MEIIQFVMQEFLLVIEKIIAMLKGEHTYPEFETELKEMLNELGREICTSVLNELDKKTYENKKRKKRLDSSTKRLRKESIILTHRA